MASLARLAATLPVAFACLLGLPTVSAGGGFFKDLEKAARKVKLDEPKRILEDIQRHPDRITQDAAKSADGVLKEIDGRKVGEQIEDTAGKVLPAVFPDISGADLDRIRELEKAVQKASPAMLKELSQVDPNKVEQVLKETDPRDLMDFVNRINRGERWLHHWPLLLASACALALILYLGAKLVHRTFGRRAKTWANWAPQVQQGTQLSMLGSNASADAEQPWISIDPLGSV
jgi:hypothetical protein